MEAVNVCRCCLSEGLHRDLFSTYVWMNNKEIYADMLSECFNISLSTSPYISNSICDPCVGCLRNAASFRDQVLKAEAAILQQITDGVKTDLIVKKEPIDSDGNVSDDYTLADTSKLLANTIKIVAYPKEEEEYELPKKKIAPKQTSFKTTPTKPKQTSLKTTQTKPKHTSLKATPTKKILKASSRVALDTKPKTVRPSHTPKFRIELIKPPRKNTAEEELETKKYKQNKINFLDKAKNRHNLQTVLKYSNVTPFKKYPVAMVGLSCVFCHEMLQNIEELRKHVDAEHILERSNYGRAFDRRELSAKVDICNLRCTLCNEKLDSLANLTTHLVDVHQKKYYTDVKDAIVPYKLDKIDDKLECALCTSTYETFKMLSQHMNTHFSNYICEICGASFLTKQSKDTHDKRHEEGEFKCQICEKVYANKQRLQYHQRMIHRPKGPYTQCPECNEPFTNYYQRNQHLIRVHNMESPYKCNICNRPFLLKTLLMYHIKKNHLMEKNVACPDCGKRFFSNRTLKGHMVKHTGEKNHVCTVCNKAYGRRYTLREHMRIHDNDRRFKCDFCQMLFVQKCSLKSHLLSNHGISMAASDISVSIEYVPS